MPPTQQGMLSGSHATIPWRLITAATGFGKTTHALELSPDASVVPATELLRDPTGVAALAGEVVVVGVHVLSDDERARLVGQLAGNAAVTAVALTSRAPLGPPGTGDGPAPFVEMDGPDELRWGAEQIVAATRSALGDPADDLDGPERADEGTVARVVDAVAHLTDGWPTLVTLVLEEGRAPWEPSADPLEVLSRPRGRVSRWVESRLLPTLSPTSRRLLLLLGDLEPVPRELVAAVEPGSRPPGTTSSRSGCSPWPRTALGSPPSWAPARAVVQRRRRTGRPGGPLPPSTISSWATPGRHCGRRATPATSSPASGSSPTTATG
ncbi:MAG: hypothetical protein U0R78_12845 [Nocardioidaceae bacterium]